MYIFTEQYRFRSDFSALDELSLLFQQIDIPNYMRTSNARMIEHQQLYFENIKTFLPTSQDGRNSAISVYAYIEKKNIMFFDMKS